MMIGFLAIGATVRQICLYDAFVGMTQPTSRDAVTETNQSTEPTRGSHAPIIVS